MIDEVGRSERQGRHRQVGFTAPEVPTNVLPPATNRFDVPCTRPYESTTLSANAQAHAAAAHMVRGRTIGLGGTFVRPRR